MDTRWDQVQTRIETDGSLGDAGSVPHVDSVYEIGETQGERRGTNLFHSFLHFDLGEGDTARFSARDSTGDRIATANVVNRVTGGEPSKLNGFLDSSDIPGANFYFLNPDGILFGPNAKLDIPAGFHASTAEDVGFADAEGSRFSASWRAGADTNLSMASLTDFGFLGDSTQRIVFDRTALTRGQVGGNVRLHAGGVDLQGGAVILTRDHGIEIVAEHSITFSGMDDSDGRGSELSVLNSLGESSAPDAGGEIRLEANSVQLSDGAEINIDNQNPKMTEGGLVTIRARDHVLLDGAEVRVGCFAEIQEEGSDNAPELQLGLSRVVGDPSRSADEVETPDDISRSAAGSISVHSPTLRLRDGGTLAAASEGAADAGDVYVGGLDGGEARLVSIEGLREGDSADSPPLRGICSSSKGTGAGGSVTVKSASLELLDGGQILALSEGSGNAGSVTLVASEVVRLSNGGRVSVEAKNADGGDIVIRGGGIVSLADSRLEARAGTGTGGGVLIGERAAPAHALILQGSSKIDASAPSGDGGRVKIHADGIFRSSESEITASGGVTEGEVVINQPETALDAQVLPTNVSFLDASSMLLAQCRAGSENRLTVARWPGLPLSPEGPLLAMAPLGGGRPALASATDSPDTGGVVVALRSGQAALRGGKAHQAEREYLAAERAASGDGDARARGEALQGLAQARLVGGAYAASLKPLKESLALARAAGNRVREASALGALGNAYVALGEFATAEELLEEAIALARGQTPLGAPKRGTSRDSHESPEAATGGEGVPAGLTAGLLNNLGNQRAISGNVPEALAAYAESAEMARSAGEPLRAAQADANTARTAQEMGDSGRAMEALQRAREALGEVVAASPTEIAALRIHLAHTEASLARRDSPLRRAALLRAHADLLRASEDAEKAGDLRSASYAFGNLGALYGEEGGRGREALYLTRRALALAERAQAADLLARWYAQAADLEWQNGSQSDSLDSYRRAVALLEETRPEASAAYGRADLAFRQAVEPIYLALVDRLLQSAATLDATVDPQASTKEQVLLSEARSVVEQWKVAELRNYFQEACAAELEVVARPLESIDPRAAIVYPIQLRDRMELLVSHSAGISRYTVPVDPAQMGVEVASFLRRVGNPTTHEYKRPAQQLYQWLVAPYAPMLAAEGIETLVFVPGGALRTIPMAALHDGEGFLLESYAVAITASLDLLAPEPLDPHQREFLLVGLSESVQGFPALPGVPGELAAIEELYGGEMLLDERFEQKNLERALVDRRPGVVHIASHAEFTGDPYSSFVLTYDDRIDMEELASLVRLGARQEAPVELLMLSACQTAAGDERAALGLAGVAIRAGARSAMGSLWPASDEVTALLVADFYDAMDNPGFNKAAALQDAQQKLMADVRFRHPHYWAAFTVINNWL